MPIEFDVVIDEVLEIEDFRNHFLLSMLNDYEDGKWRYKRFMNCLWNNIAETALSAKERQALIKKERFFELVAKSAYNLRLTDKKDIGQGGEIAEILLYAIMKHFFGAISVVPKIFYKQNSKDNAKGADSVHIVINGNDDFSLWLGEAKFYTSIEDCRLGGILRSIKEHLDKEKIRKENLIITNLQDLDLCIKNKNLLTFIKKELSEDKSIDDVKTRLHIPILLLHECSITKEFTEFSPEYKEKIKIHHINRARSYFEKQIEELNEVYGYEKITFHLILFPVPDKQGIVDRFYGRAKEYRRE